MNAPFGQPSDSRALRDAFACFPSGVTALCAMVDGEPVGMAASAFTSVSIDPPLVSVCIQSASATWLKLRRTPRLGVSVLSEAHDIACRALSAKSGDRFAGIDWSAAEEGAIFIDGAAAHLDCSLHGRFDAGDHEIALFRIHWLRTRPEVEPLVFHGSRFRRLSPLTSQREGSA